MSKNGLGGQSSSVAQELCKDWVDNNGVTHPGLYDEDFPDMVRWAEKYPHAVPGVLKMMEPNKYRSAMFDAVRVLAPMGDLIFAAEDPKDDYLLIPNESGQDEPRKLSRAEKESLIQMRLMIEEMCLIVRSKNKQTGKITYGLPPEWARKVHDDRAYVMAMAAWAIKQEQETTELGEPKGLDYNCLTSMQRTSEVKETNADGRAANPWLSKMTPHKKNNRTLSPFQGKSPFTK